MILLVASGVLVDCDGYNRIMEATRQSQIDPQIPWELHRRASQVARQARRLYFLRAGLSWLAFSVSLSVVLVAVDYGLHVEEFGLRWLLSLVWLSSILAAAIWIFRSALAFRLNVIQLADWVERAKPQYRGRLTAAVALVELPMEDERFGSRQLRTEALKRLGATELNSAWEHALSFRSTMLAAGWLAASLIGLGCIASVQPQPIYLGFDRLLRPWAAKPWPRADELQFVDLPSVIATGSELPIVVVDRKPPLPESVAVQVRFQQLPEGESAGDQASEQLRELPLRLANEAAIGTWSETRRNFEIRAVGGDDRNSAWHQVQVADLPQLTASRFYVQPPAYSHQPSGELVGQRIEVLAGSRVTFFGSYSAPVQAVEALVRGPNAESPASSGDLTDVGDRTMTAAIAEDRQAFRLFADDPAGQVIEGDLHWQLRVTTQAGLEMTDPTHWFIHVVPDRPPVVTLFPADPPWLTSDSRMLVAGQASDDLELVELNLKWQVAGSSEATWQAQRLWSSTDSSQTTGVEITPTAVEDKTVRSLNLAYPWSLAAQQFPIGSTLSLVLEARDSSGQVSRSVPQTITIQDARSVLARAEQEQTLISAPLQQLSQAQRRNAESIDKLSEIVRRTDVVDTQQLETLSAARQLQQSIGQQLGESAGGMIKKLKVLAEQLARSGLEHSSVAEELKTLITEMERFNAGALQPADQDLATTENLWRENLQTTTSANVSDAARAQLQTLSSSQRQAADQLAQIVRELDSATTTAQLHREVTELAVRQREVQAATEQLQLQRLVSPSSREQQAAQVGLRADEQNLARSLDDLGARIDQLLQQSTNQTDRDIRNLTRLRQSMLDQQIGQQMRDAADSLQSDKLSEAIRQQRAAAQSLEQAASEFSSSDSGTLADQSGNLADLAQQFDALSQQQAQLGEEIEQLAGAAPAAARSQQQTLGREQARVIEQLHEVLRNPEVSSSESLKQLVQAAEESAQTAQSQLRDDQWSGAVSSQQQSSEQLRQAERLTAQRAEALQQQAAQQQLYDLRGNLEALIRQQQSSVQRIEDLGNQQPVAEAADARWEKSVSQAAAGQQAISQQLESILSQASAIETFEWVLTRAHSDMVRAAAALQRQRVQPDATRSAREALRKLRAVASASEEARSQESEVAEENREAADKTPEPDAAKNSRRGPALASLKLLREMQAAVREQTAALDGDSSPEAQSLVLRLAEEQAALAEQTRKLMELMVD